MYADVTTGKTKLVYLPVEREIEEPDITALIKEMMFSVNYDETENTGYIARLMNYLNSVGKVDLDELSGILQELKVDAFMEGGAAEKTEQPVYQPSVQSPSPVERQVYQQPVYRQPVHQADYHQPVQQMPRTLPETGQLSWRQAAEMSEQKPIYKTGLRVEPLRTLNIPEPTSGTTVLGKGAFNSLSSAQSVRPDEMEMGRVQEQDSPKEQSVAQEQPKKRKGLFGFMKKNEAAAGPQSKGTPEQEGIEVNDRARTYDPNLAPKNYMRKQEFNADAQQPISPAFGAAPAQPAYQQPNYQMPQRVSNGTTALNRPNKSGSGTTILNGGAGGFAAAPDQYVPTLVLRRERTGQEMKITKSIFHIGAEYSYADFYIPDNSAISRSHADIIVRGNKYYVKDSNSLNHTYLNGEMLTSNVEYALRSGDTIVLANEAFEFRVR